MGFTLKNYDKLIRRAIYKTLTFRVLAFITTILVTYLITGQFLFSIKLAIALNISKMVLYYFHEIAWSKY